ncbi:competence type IV pilus minor pilin ComGF [Salsuginibacillus kocurii]|uniref:competence type IV pilus minor pilin ComGF n=1 Tax=Salsuginibacillus kocurii TaxID=427078 RepID=UPI0003602C90|nr:competence type IV pilus minor pilin ComGF [Salsuginibacillus kocurii]
MKTKDESGFTLLETIIASLVFFTIVPLLVYFIYLLQSATASYASNEQELILFSQRLTQEAKSAVRIEEEHEHVALILGSGKVVTYSQSNNQLIRRVDQSGHEIVLQGVDEFNIESHSNQTVVHLNLQNGGSYELPLYTWLVPEEVEKWVREVP